MLKKALPHKLGDKRDRTLPHITNLLTKTVQHLQSTPAMCSGGPGMMVTIPEAPVWKQATASPRLSLHRQEACSLAGMSNCGQGVSRHLSRKQVKLSKKTDSMGSLSCLLSQTIQRRFWQKSPHICLQRGSCGLLWEDHTSQGPQCRGLELEVAMDGTDNGV